MQRNVDIFQNRAAAIPESDPQIDREDLERAEIGGRKSHMPDRHFSAVLPLSHLENK